MTANESRLTAAAAASVTTDLPSEARALAAEFWDEAAETDTVDRFPVKAIELLRQNGFLTAGVLDKFGGRSLGLEAGSNVEFLQTLKEIGRGNLVVGRVFEGHFNALQLIDLYASEDQKKRYAADAIAGRLFGVWNTEAGDGVKLEPLPNGRVRLSGSKTFATGVEYVTRPVVNGALPDGGWVTMVVPLDEAEDRGRPFVVEADGHAFVRVV